jgi:thiol-disulfide isomerase/thioredoxin
MNVKFFIQAKVKTSLKFAVFTLVFASFFSTQIFAQKTKKVSPKTSAANVNLPKVTQIDETNLKTLLKPNGKPLLVNFWATWCDPCREEFPELVKINADYKDKIDFITISMDDLAEIKREVPKFLADMKAEMPAYLLKPQSEDQAIAAISKDWSGGLPFTILFNEKGETVYFKQGKIKPEILRAEIDKALSSVAQK